MRKYTQEDHEEFRRKVDERAAGPDSWEEIDAEGPPGKTRPWH